MTSFGIKLPITRDDISGFTTLTSFKQTIKQNFKMLLLTNPGERVMIPDYGVGVKRYIFENYGSGIEGELKAKIMEQASFFMPVIQIMDIDINASRMDVNELSMNISYIIPDTGIRDLLKFTI
tara:strand:+ start:59937 stop:60305 length:369 start_codon:yes stop_codon:yes gene_type:complete